MRQAMRKGWRAIRSQAGLALLLCLASFFTVCSGWAEEPAGDEWARLFRKPNHPIVNEQAITERDLDSHPMPFLDWGIIQPGFVEYVDTEGKIVPLSGEHSIENPDTIPP